MKANATDAPRPIELLAPARDLACGKAAIDHGADAVYIGAAHFGARVAAGNSIDDIRELCTYAHQFGARVYVTLNTIVYDDELPEAKRLVDEVAEAGADALLVQDMALAAYVLEHHSIGLHASTQTDNRSALKVRWLAAQGFSRVVLARELSVKEIAEIHAQAPDTELEAFVHGALCVSYSGACYASEHCFRRSANRGACAQFCRLAFDLTDADGQVIAHDRHLLSLKDLCQIDVLEQLLSAGVCSLKIEGRLKDETYVKNVVAAYSQRLNQIISQHPAQYCRASYGHVDYSFTPNLEKTFNRGFTHYFLHGRQPDIASFDTPKALGEYVGRVKEIRGRSFSIAGTSPISNGDGLCFFNAAHKLEGFRVNRAENNLVFPSTLPDNLRKGVALYRNNDQVFERTLASTTACRRMGLSLTLSLNGNQLCLTAEDEARRTATVAIDIDPQPAQKPQADNIRRQLSRLGNTLFQASEIELKDGVGQLFVPSSLLAELRRSVVDKLTATPIDRHETAKQQQSESLAVDVKEANLANIANREARAFYARQGLEDVPTAYELRPSAEQPLMTCRHCLRYSLGHCVRHGGRRPTWREPLTLSLPDGRRFRLHFNCNACQMEIYAQP